MPTPTMKAVVQSAVENAAKYRLKLLNSLEHNNLTTLQVLMRHYAFGRPTVSYKKEKPLKEYIIIPDDPSPNMRGLRERFKDDLYLGSIPLSVLGYIAQEVTRQGDDQMAVYGMACAWKTAMDTVKSMGALEPTAILTKPMLCLWAYYISPKNKNPLEYRTVRVSVGGDERAQPGAALRAAMKKWFNDLHLWTPAEAYYHFQLIHPFADGNGRTGKIILNYLNGTLDAPVMPPNFFHCLNP